MNEFESLVNFLSYYSTKDLFYIRDRFVKFINTKELCYFRVAILCIEYRERVLLAKLLGVTQSTLVDWSSGSMFYAGSISISYALRISKLVIKAIDEAYNKKHLTHLTSLK